MKRRESKNVGFFLEELSAETQATCRLEWDWATAWVAWGSQIRAWATMIEFEVTMSKRELRWSNRERIEPRLSRVRFCWVNVAVSTTRVGTWVRALCPQ
jgi:hypothetical protein